MIKRILGTVLALGMLASTQAQAFDYIAPIKFHNPGTVALTDYQMAIDMGTIHMVNLGRLKDDCSDIRFLSADKKTILPHYREGTCRGRSTFWVKIDYLPPGQSFLYVIFGDQNAEDISDRDRIFDFYEDFDGPDLAGDLGWTLERNDGLDWWLDNSKLYMRANPLLPIKVKLGGRIIFNSSYKYNKDVMIEWSRSYTDNSSVQIGHVIVHGASRSEINGRDGLVHIAHTATQSAVEFYYNDIHSAVLCQTPTYVHAVACEPYSKTIVDTLVPAPVGDAWVDQYGQRKGPRSETLGLSVVVNDPWSYTNSVYVDWIRGRKFASHVPTYEYLSTGWYTGTPIPLPPFEAPVYVPEKLVSCDAEIDAAYLAGKSAGYDEGKAQGLLDGDSDGYDAGYEVGKQKGEDDGFVIGYGNGKVDGFADGYQNGYDAGFADGDAQGYAAAFPIGLEQGDAAGVALCQADPKACNIVALPGNGFGLAKQQQAKSPPGQAKK